MIRRALLLVALAVVLVVVLGVLATVGVFDNVDEQQERDEAERACFSYPQYSTEWENCVEDYLADH